MNAWKIRLAALLCTLCLAPAEPPKISFLDVSRPAGVDALIVSGGAEKNHVLEVNGSGACWFDFNGDGFQDLYLVNGGTLASLQGKAPRPGANHLYRNNRNGTFTDVTQAAGVGGRGWGFGCVPADFDNDGRPDLLVTNFGPNHLYRNRGDGTFEDVAARAGVSGGNVWHTGAAFADFDRDGKLDLYVAGYLDFDTKNPVRKTCEYRGITVHACGPLGYRGAPDALYRNNGDGTFTDVTAKAGVTDENLYFGFAVVFEDLDGDGLPDLFVGNDSNPNYFYRNQGDGSFEERAAAAGLAYTGDGKAMSSMGAAVGDYDRDGRTDLFVTTFANDNYVLFHNDGEGFFSDVSYPAGVAEPTIPYLGWATFFFDYDNDGWLDLLCANGHVYPEVDRVRKDSYAQPLQLFRNAGRNPANQQASFTDVSASAGLRALPLQPARGGAFADYDNDGDLDLVISNIDARPQLLENRGGNAANWIGFQLEGLRSNRSAIGARITLTSGGSTQTGRVRTGAGYLSSNDLRLHFGLGDRATVSRVEIEWPSGAVEVIENLAARKYYSIVEGKGVRANLPEAASKP